MDKGHAVYSAIKIAIDDSLVDRFWKKVLIPEDKNDCWIWSAFKTKNGQGTIKSTDNKNRYYAHRVSYVIHNGCIPIGVCICHKCDNPPCVNPSHLFLGTLQDNFQDMISKNRGNMVKRQKFNKEDVKRILILHRNGCSYSEIGRRFGSATIVISNIIRGKKSSYREMITDILAEMGELC